MLEAIETNDPVALEKAQENVTNWVQMIEPDRMANAFRRTNNGPISRFLLSAQGNRNTGYSVTATNIASTSAALPATNSPIAASAPADIPFRWVDSISISGITAFNWDSNNLWIAKGTTLQKRNPFREVTENVNIPFPLKHNINAIVPDESGQWLGTDGDGLVRIFNSGSPCQTYTEREGLLMPSITALCETSNRLWIGFGFRESGGLGYLDLRDNKFTGVISEVGMFKSDREQREGPPDSAITAIKKSDDTTLWVASIKALNKFDIGTQKWTLALPFGPSALSVNSNFVAVGCPEGGVMFCKLPEMKWKKISFGTNFWENLVHSVQADAFSTRFLWVGNHTKIRVIDMETSQIVGIKNFFGVSGVPVIAAGPEVITIFSAGQLATIEKPLTFR